MTPRDTFLSLAPQQWRQQKLLSCPAETLLWWSWRNQLTYVRKCWHLKRLNLHSAPWFVKQCLSICLLVCVYIHKQALLLPVGQDVSGTFRTGTDTECTAELYSDILVKEKTNKKKTFVHKLGTRGAATEHVETWRIAKQRQTNRR